MNTDDFATCPYNATHRVPHSRLQHHLIKCQKTSPKLLICSFNATHRFPESLMHHHYITCPDRPPDESKPKAGQIGTIGALTVPTPLLQKEYLPEKDPENEYWDD